LRQLGLTIIEGPEALGAELQGAGYMQRVEGADAEGGAVAAGQVDAGLPGSIGELDRMPDSLLAIFLEFVPCEGGDCC